MQAAVIERPGNVILRKVPIPVVKAGEILVKVRQSKHSESEVLTTGVFR